MPSQYNFSLPLIEQARALISAFRGAKLTLATAESCTGGMVAAVLTEIDGSSNVLERGFVTYSNEAKIEQLGVAPGLIAGHGAVSEEVARAMAEGAISHSKAALAVSLTGIAGPGGATPTKPVGLVHIAAARRGGGVLHIAQVFPGDRAAVRAASVLEAFRLLRRVAGV